jgi:glycosyltransferase involved in cell wall biosynthesis
VSGPPESIAVVIVTHNRADLLERMLDGLRSQTRQPDAVIVIDNVSTDDTRAVLDGRTDLPLHVTTTASNLGGAGGFHVGMRAAYDAGWDRIWLMDDDVVPDPDCLAALMATDESCLIAVRDDLDGNLVEKAAVRFDYMFRNLFVVHFRYGENVLVRLKPWLIALGVVLLSPLRGGRGEAGNVIRAIRSARGMRHLTRVAGPPR